MAIVLCREEKRKKEKKGRMIEDWICRVSKGGIAAGSRRITETLPNRRGSEAPCTGRVDDTRIGRDLLQEHSCCGGQWRRTWCKTGWCRHQGKMMKRKAAIEQGGEDWKMPKRGDMEGTTE